MKVYALKAFTEDGEILLAIYRHEQHAQRHADKLESDEKLCDIRRLYGIKDTTVFEIEVKEDYVGP